MKINHNIYNRILYHSFLTIIVMPIVNIKISDMLTDTPVGSNLVYLALFTFTPILTAMLFSLERSNDESKS